MSAGLMLKVWESINVNRLRAAYRIALGDDAGKRGDDDLVAGDLLLYPVGPCGRPRGCRRTQRRRQVKAFSEGRDLGVSGP